MNYLIIGDSTTELVYQDLLNKLTLETPNIVQKQFDASLKEEELFFQSISINSMFGGKELLVLKRAEKIDKIWNFFKAMNNFNILNKDIIIIYTSSLNEFGKEVKPFPKKARKEVDGNFKLIEVSDKDGNTIINYIMNTLRVDKSTAIKFKDMVGGDLSTIHQEMDKINNFLGNEKFSFEKVENILTVSKEYNVFDMVKEVLQGKKENSLVYLKKSKEHLFFLNILMGELLNLLKLSILFEEGEIRSTKNYNLFKVDFEKNKNLFRNKKGYSHPYPIFLKLSLIERFNSDLLQKYLDKVLDIEGRFKSGNGELDIMLETFILEI
jgi:DNA polymerase-3 subunit delta